MKRHKWGMNILKIGGVLIAFSVIGYLLYAYAVNIEKGARYAVLGVTVAATAVGVGLSITGTVFVCKPDREIRRKMAEYVTYPNEKISDFKQQLDAVRENFDADADPLKNKIEYVAFPNSRPYYDYSVVKNGKIYYGYLVEANNILFSPKKFSEAVLPAVIVYGVDAYYDSHPLELKKIAEELYKNKNNNILRDERKYFSNIKVSDKLTGGREVYMTTIMVYRMHLPLCYLSGSLFPVIANPDNCTSVFIADVKYWTENLIGNYINGFDADCDGQDEAQPQVFDDL